MYVYVRYCSAKPTNVIEKFFCEELAQNLGLLSVVILQIKLPRVNNGEQCSQSGQEL
jgi:hypothetical protein